MSWSASQRQRLAFEKSLLEKYFQNRVTWIDPTEAGETKVEVLVTCSNDKQYILRVYLPSDFPNSVPPMIVKTPSMTTLKKRNGNNLDGSMITFTESMMAVPKSAISNRVCGKITTRYTKWSWKDWYGWKRIKPTFVQDNRWMCIFPKCKYQSS